MRRLAVLASALALVACAPPGQKNPFPPLSGDDEKSPPVTLEGKVNDEGTKTLRGDELELEADDFYFEPTYVEAEAGATVKVEVENEGKATHTFTIDSLEIDQEIQPDEKKEISVTLPSSGTVNYYCRFHRAQGMQGAFYFG